MLHACHPDHSKFDVRQFIFKMLGDAFGTTGRKEPVFPYRKNPGTTQQSIASTVFTMSIPGLSSEQKPLYLYPWSPGGRKSVCLCSSRFSK
jgi:hypothetical protein